VSPPAEDGDTAPFDLAHGEDRVVARDAGMGKAWKVGVWDGGAVDPTRDMAEARAEDQAEADGGRTRAGTDKRCEGFSVP
jgi:hypothetical protein